MVSPPRVPRNAERAQSKGRAKEGSTKRGQRHYIGRSLVEPARGFRRTAVGRVPRATSTTPRAAPPRLASYNETVGGTVGRASRARLSTPRQPIPLLSGTCLTSAGRPPLRRILATEGPGPEGYPGQITYSTRCNDDTARECTRFPPRRPASRPRARGSASRRSTSKLLARALERRSGPLRCRRDHQWMGARGVR